jgi:galactokinase
MSDDPRRARLAGALGGAGVRFHRAPGRVNLLGGHVDYHEGWVVAMAIDRDVVVASRARDDGRVVASSLDLAGVADLRADGTTEPARTEPVWARAVAGVLRTLAEEGRDPVGADLAIATDLPIGAGLSSSAALEVAVALALLDVAGRRVPAARLARATQRAEHLASGVPCGVQDQLVALAGVEGHALLVDCRTLDVEAIRLPAAARVLVVHSGIPRALAGTPYAERRAEGEAVAARLGLRALRDATPEQVVDEPRARHAVSEMRRVLAFADALRAGDLDALGALMLAGHASLRDDMEVSLPELDALVECAVAAGAFGARLTGGGFGGCVVALVPVDAAPRVCAATVAAYRERTGLEPTAWLVRAAGGAGPYPPRE